MDKKNEISSSQSERKFEENLIVYEAIKNTALHCEDGIRNARINMYIVYFALIAFSFNYHWLFLVSFFVLISFQAMINNESIAIQRISAYIQVFFEDNRNDMHWSKLNQDEEHLIAYQPLYKNIGWYINYASASLLAICSLLAMLVTYMRDYSFCEVPNEDWIALGLAVILCGVVIFINSMTYSNKPCSTNTNKDTNKTASESTKKDIYKSIKDFYDKL